MKKKLHHLIIATYATVFLAITVFAITLLHDLDHQHMKKMFHPQEIRRK